MSGRALVRSSRMSWLLFKLMGLESPVISLSRSKQRALQGREFEVSWLLNEPLALLNDIQFWWLALRI